MNKWQKNRYPIFKKVILVQDKDKCILTKRTNHGEGFIIMNTCSSIIHAAGWNKQSAEPNRTYNPCSIIVCDFNTSLSLILHLHTEKEKKTQIRLKLYHESNWLIRQWQNNPPYSFRFTFVLAGYIILVHILGHGQVLTNRKMLKHKAKDYYCNCCISCTFSFSQWEIPKH